MNAEEKNTYLVSTCLNEFLEQKKREESSDGYVSGKIIFRGLSNSQWGVLSSAARRLSIDEKLRCQRDFIRYHVNLIKHARRFGYGHFHPGYHLSDLEILAEIQHLGGATCLTDFSTNLLIALWFATAPTKNDKNEECDGKIVWLDLSHPANFSQIMYYTEERDKEKKTIQQILTSYEFIKHTKKQNKALPSFWIWEPAKMNVRIDKQESIFLFGLRKFPQQMDKEDSLRYREIIIPGKYKEQIRDELANYLGISAETVYHDLQGYASNSNGCNISIGKNLLSQANCLAIAKNCVKTGEFSLAMSYIDQMIECHQKRKKCQTNICINRSYKNQPNDINNSCSINLGEVYFWRARAVENRRDIEKEEAILNYHEAINNFLNNNETSNVLLYDAYQNLIYLYYEIHDYYSALEEAKKLWSLFSDRKDNKSITDADRDGHDAILTILELLIILNRKDDFIKYKTTVDDMKIVNERFRYTNGAIMWVLFRYLGKLIWDIDNENKSRQSSYDEKRINTWMDVIENRISKTIAPENKNIPKDYVKFVGYYYWDFSDLLEEIRKNKYGWEPTIIHDAILLIEKADEAQGKLINHLLLINDAFD